MTKWKLTYQVKRLLMLMLAWELLFWVAIFLFFEFGLLVTSSGKGALIFQTEEQLFWLWLLVPVAGVFVYNLMQREQISTLFTTKNGTIVFKGEVTTSAFIPYFLFRNALVFLIFAMAQPAFGTKKVAGTTQSMELVISLDISNSMNTYDIDPSISRLNIAKRAINELINKLGGEKMGISVFAGEASTILPLTLDYYAAKLFVNDIETNMMSNQGTNIKAALEDARAMFSEDKKLSKAVILVTDGENHDEDPSEVLKAYREQGIQLAILGIGTAKGGLVPADPERPERGYKKTAIGESVHSKLNASMLKQLADEAGGIAIISESAFPDLRSIMTKLSQMKRENVAGVDFEVKEQRYQWPLMVSILFFMAYFLWVANAFYLKRK